jgi:prepilin-type N-terminal cleavage/methylation domain-containing protein
VSDDGISSGRVRGCACTLTHRVRDYGLPREARGARARREGFTLLELLIVVIIIAILSSLALPQYLRLAERSRGAEALTVLRDLRSAELRYKAVDEDNLFTKDLDILDVDIPGFSGIAVSRSWAFEVDGTDPGSRGLAERTSGNRQGETIQIDLDLGEICSTVGDIYGLAGC